MRLYDELVQQCDDDIRWGRAHNVGKRLTQLNVSRVPRIYRLPLAMVCRRAGLYSLGLKLLIKVVLSKDFEPTAPELAEYAVLLLRSGATSEALEKLARVNVHHAPEALLYRAFCHFLRWEYKEAIPRLEQYLRSDLSAYARLLGQTNLAFALAETHQSQAALELLEENISSATQARHQQLQSNCHALRAQIYAQNGDFASARQEIAMARTFFAAAQTNDQFFAEKWELILDGLESKSAKPFDLLRERAIQTRNWEAHREADLYALKFDFIRQRFMHLYFGTPFAGFRERIFVEIGSIPNQPFYIYGMKSAPRLDLQSGEINGRPVLNPGGKCHQLIEALLRDFYQPLRIGGLFSILFPCEQFNISSSPDRVHQLLRRTRSWIRQRKIPIEIHEADGFYTLRIIGQFSFRVPLERQLIHHHRVHFEKLKALYRDSRPFTAKQAREELNLSTTTVHRLIHWGIAEGVIMSHGETDRSTLFQVLEKKSA